MRVVRWEVYAQQSHLLHDSCAFGDNVQGIDGAQETDGNEVNGKEIVSVHV